MVHVEHAEPVEPRGGLLAPGTLVALLRLRHVERGLEDEGGQLLLQARCLVVVATSLRGAHAFNQFLRQGRSHQRPEQFRGYFLGGVKEALLIYKHLFTLAIAVNK